jgi:hypothetical protein
MTIVLSSLDLDKYTFKYILTRSETFYVTIFPFTRLDCRLFVQHVITVSLFSMRLPSVCSACDYRPFVQREIMAKAGQPNKFHLHLLTSWCVDDLCYYFMKAIWEPKKFILENAGNALLHVRTLHEPHHVTPSYIMNCTASVQCTSWNTLKYAEMSTGSLILLPYFCVGQNFGL